MDFRERGSKGLASLFPKKAKRPLGLSGAYYGKKSFSLSPLPGVLGSTISPYLYPANPGTRGFPSNSMPARAFTTTGSIILTKAWDPAGVR